MSMAESYEGLKAEPRDRDRGEIEVQMGRLEKAAHVLREQTEKLQGRLKHVSISQPIAVDDSPVEARNVVDRPLSPLASALSVTASGIETTTVLLVEIERALDL